MKKELVDLVVIWANENRMTDQEILREIENIVPRVDGLPKVMLNAMVEEGVFSRSVLEDAIEAL